MGFRFFRRFRIAPGIAINLSKTGISASLGPKGAKVTLGRRGTRTTIGLPGTGLYYTTLHSGKKRASPKSKKPATPQYESLTREEIIKKKLTLNFLSRLFLPKSEENFVDGLKAFLEKDEKRALACFQKSLNLPDSAFMAGLIFLNNDNPQQAIIAFHHVQNKIDLLGSLFKKIGIYMSLYLPLTEEMQVEIWPDNRGLYLALIEAKQRLAKHDEAIMLLRKIVDESPNDIAFRLSLAELLADASEREEKSHGIYKEIVALSNNVENETALHSALLFYRGKALYYLGYHTLARNTLTTALGRKKGRPRELLTAIRYERARVYEALGQKKRAQNEFEIVNEERKVLDLINR